MQPDYQQGKDYSIQNPKSVCPFAMVGCLYSDPRRSRKSAEQAFCLQGQGASIASLNQIRLRYKVSQVIQILRFVDLLMSKPEFLLLVPELN